MRVRLAKRRYAVQQKKSAEILQEVKVNMGELELLDRAVKDSLMWSRRPSNVTVQNFQLMQADIESMLKATTRLQAVNLQLERDYTIQHAITRQLYSLWEKASMKRDMILAKVSANEEEQKSVNQEQDFDEITESRLGLVHSHFSE